LQNFSSTLDESVGKLNVGGSVGAAGADMIIRYNQAIGDVGSVRIDYSWVFCTGHKSRFYLGLYDSSWTGGADHDGVFIKTIRYGTTGGSRAIDSGDPNGLYDIDYGTPSAGSLLIERNGDTFRTSYLQSGSWQLLLESSYDFGSTPLYPYLRTSNSDDNPAWKVALDNYTLEYSEPAAVPEPSSLVLFSGLGIAGLVMSWRRKRPTAPQPV